MRRRSSICAHHTQSQAIFFKKCVPLFSAGVCVDCRLKTICYSMRLRHKIQKFHCIRKIAIIVIIIIIFVVVIIIYRPEAIIFIAITVPTRVQSKGCIVSKK